MRLDFMVVFSNLLGLFLLIGAGFLAARLRILPKEASPYFSTLLLKITLPCTIFISLATKEYDPSFIKDSLLTLGIGLVAFPAMQLLGSAGARLLRVPEGKRGIWAYGCAYPNTGFMGFPICLALFGAEGLALAVIYNITFNIYVYSIGAIAIAGDGAGAAAGATAGAAGAAGTAGAAGAAGAVSGSGSAGGQGRRAGRPSLKKVLFTGINFSVLLSLLFYFGRIPVPGPAVIPLTHLSNITTPLSMLITGIAIGQNRGAELFSDRDAWTASAARLLVCPLLLFAVLSHLPIQNRMIVSVISVIMGMPVPGVTTVLAETYHGNLGMAAKLSLLTNLLSMVTIPLICMLL